MTEAPEEVTEEELMKYKDVKLRDRLAHLNKGYHEERRANQDTDRHRREWIEEGLLFRDPVRTLKTLFGLPDSFSRNYLRNDFLRPETGSHKGLVDALEGR